jgi:hypothetical protein
MPCGFFTVFFIILGCVEKNEREIYCRYTVSLTDAEVLRNVGFFNWWLSTAYETSALGLWTWSLMVATVSKTCCPSRESVHDDGDRDGHRNIELLFRINAGDNSRRFLCIYLWCELYILDQYQALLSEIRENWTYYKLLIKPNNITRRISDDRDNLASNPFQSIVQSF